MAEEWDPFDRRRAEEFQRATHGKEQAYVREVRTLCTVDCEPPDFHVPEYERCARCGSMLHKRLIDIEHPVYGDITVGSECVKDVMGWKWSKSHEQALETQAAFDEQLGRQGTVWTDVYKLKARILKNVRVHNASKGLGIGIKYAKIELPYGWIERLWRAAGDMQLPWITAVDPFEERPLGRDAIGISGANPDWFNWTAALPGMTEFFGAQSPQEDAARNELRNELLRLQRVARDRNSDYSPRGALWRGPWQLIERVKLQLWGDFVQFPPGSYL